MITTNFLTYDFKDERFDLVVMNPPFTENGNASIVTKFMRKAYKLSNIVASFSGLSGGASYVYSAKIDKNANDRFGQFFSYFKYMSFDAFNVGVEASMFIIDFTKKVEGFYATLLTGNKEYIEIKKYPNKIPLIRGNFTLKDYDEVFDQVNGIKPIRGSEKAKRTKGVLRDGDTYFYGILEGTTHSYAVIPCTEEQSKKIINRLKREVLDPYYGFGHKRVMFQLDPVRAD